MRLDTRYLMMSLAPSRMYDSRLKLLPLHHSSSDRSCKEYLPESLMFTTAVIHAYTSQNTIAFIDSHTSGSLCLRYSLSDCFSLCICISRSTAKYELGTLQKVYLREVISFGIVYLSQSSSPIYVWWIVEKHVTNMCVFSCTTTQYG